MHANSRRNTVLGLGALVAVGAILFAWAFQHVPADRWTARTSRLNALKDDAKSGVVKRDLLRGTVHEGKSWEEYNLALNDGVSWADDPNGSALDLFLRADPQADSARIGALLVAHAKAIEHLRLGAQGADGRYPYEWEKGMAAPLPSLLASRRVVNLAAAQAKVWIQRGRAQDAAELLLDVTMFGKDLTIHAPLLSCLIGITAYKRAFDGFRDILVSGQLTQAQTAELARRLQTVDQAFPTIGSMLAAEELFSGLTLLDVADASPLNAIWWQLLREGNMSLAMTSRSTILDALEQKERLQRRSEKLDTLSYAEAQKEAGAITEEAHHSPNTLIAMAWPDVTKIAILQRETLARLRLLRSAAGLLAGDTPKLSDPFGDTLAYTREAGKAKLWSRGSDGKDQGGSGNWQDGRPDLVLELNRQAVLIP